MIVNEHLKFVMGTDKKHTHAKKLCTDHVCSYSCKRGNDVKAQGYTRQTYCKHYMCLCITFSTCITYNSTAESVSIWDVTLCMFWYDDTMSKCTFPRQPDALIYHNLQIRNQQTAVIICHNLY